MSGLELARARRPGVRSDRDLARGPARLARCLGVTGEMDGVDTTSTTSPLWVGTPADAGTGRVEIGPRVGLSRAADRPWRLWLAGEPSVSQYRSHTPRRRRVRGSGTLDADRPIPGGDPPP